MKNRAKPGGVAQKLALQVSKDGLIDLFVKVFHGPGTQAKQRHATGRTEEHPRPAGRHGFFQCLIIWKAG
jgi:hypothetical protein